MIHYFILAHKSPAQLEILIDSLTAKNTKIYVHIDGYTDIDPFVYLQKKVHFIQKRVKIRWGGFSMVQATLYAFEEIIKHMQAEDHLVVMSGQDLPIKSQSYISDYLRKYIDKSFIQYDIQPNQNWNVLNRIIKYHFHDLVIPDRINLYIHKYISLFVKIPPLRNQIFCYIVQRFVNLCMPTKKFLLMHYTIYRGSSRQIISQKHIQYIIDFCQTRMGKKFIQAFKTTAGPDEFFFQTLLLNSQYKNDIHNDVLRYMNRKKGPGLPRILDSSDLEDIKISNKLFARKFDVDFDKNIFYKLTH